jgi:hypothetical protein
MKILFSPQSRFDALTLSREGDTLRVNDVTLDFSTLTEGDVLPVLDPDTGETLHGTGSDWVLDVRRHEGRIEIKVLLPVGAEAPEAVRFPQPLVMDGDGPVPMPG